MCQVPGASSIPAARGALCCLCVEGGIRELLERRNHTAACVLRAAWVSCWRQPSKHTELAFFQSLKAKGSSSRCGGAVHRVSSTTH